MRSVSDSLHEGVAGLRAGGTREQGTGRRLAQKGLTEGMTQMRLLEMYVARRSGRACIDVRNSSRVPPSPKTCAAMH